MPQDNYHLVLTASHIKRSQQFYDQLFTQLQWKKVAAEKALHGYSDGTLSVWITAAQNKKSTTHHFKSVGFHHLAIRVSTKKRVDEIYEWCLQQKIRVVDPPAHYPQYSKCYYAVFFVDPDGMKLEIMCT